MQGQTLARSNIRSILKACRFFLILTLAILSGPYAFAIDSAPSSESSFAFFITEDGKPGNLHDSFYTQEEIAIVENYIEQISLPRSQAKDDLIAIELAKKVKLAHGQLVIKEIENSCCFWLNSSLPNTNNLEEIVLHALYGRKFLGVGRNRTFEVLKNLNWVDNNNKVTSTCPRVFEKIWQKALGAGYF